MLARLRKRSSLTVEVLFKGWNTILVVKASSRKKREGYFVLFQVRDHPVLKFTMA